MTAGNNTRYIERGQSRAHKLILGVGFNSKRKHIARANGRNTKVYQTWRNMLSRCYDKDFQKQQPTYLDCTVADEWHDFQNFADWIESHEYAFCGYELDKDVLIPNNKIYSEATCVLLPRDINALFNNRSRYRGDYPLGVRFHKSICRFEAQINLSGNRKSLGYFDCPNEAHRAYKRAKEAYVKQKALEWQGRIADNVFQALMDWTLDS